MKSTLLLLSLFITTHGFSQSKLPVKISDFSSRYEAEVDENKVSKQDSTKEIAPLVVRVYEKKSRRLLIENELWEDLSYLTDDDGKVTSNVLELPYGFQSVLIYEDVNFDGISDLALKNGNNSCYSGPSYDIFLGTQDHFEYNADFSVLSNEYCGMFEVDEQTKTIRTMTKSGCCWHQYSQFKVVNNVPQAVVIVEESMSAEPPQLVETTSRTWKNGKENVSTDLYLPYDLNPGDTLLFFQLEKSKKQVMLFRSEEHVYYALLKPDGRIEFYFPKPTYDEETGTYQYPLFTFDPKARTLRFQHKDAEYLVYQGENRIGIQVTFRGKTVNLQGVPQTAIGSLEKLNSGEEKNISIHSLEEPLPR